jgi:predicted XRE-type DNA-binding protein
MRATKGNENVFVDCGFPPAEAENLRIRAKMMMALTGYIQERKITQSRAARVMGVSQPRISDLMRGKIGRFTIDTLVNMVTAAGRRLHLNRWWRLQIQLKPGRDVVILRQHTADADQNMPVLDLRDPLRTAKPRRIGPVHLHAGRAVLEGTIPNFLLLLGYSAIGPKIEIVPGPVPITNYRWCCAFAVAPVSQLARRIVQGQFSTVKVKRGYRVGLSTERQVEQIPLNRPAASLTSYRSVLDGVAFKNQAALEKTA